MECDPVGKEMIISSTAKSRPLWMSGKKGNITHSLQNKIQQLESFRDAGEIVIKSWDLCVKQKLAAPLRNGLMQCANTEGD